MGKTLQTMGLKVEAQTRLQVEGHEVELPPVWIHHLVCIGHEAVSNAARHASPHQIDVQLSYAAERLELAVQDDGCGFQRAVAPSSNSGHFGLAVMEERARKMGGRFEIHSAPGRGTRLVVQIPVPATVER
jgi:signal transduction histidine kinase